MTSVLRAEFCYSTIVLLSVSAAFACASVPTLPGKSVPSPIQAFVNVSVVPMDSERVLSGQTVLVQGGRIIALGSTSHVRVPPNAMRIDGQGKYLIPGLADMHMHLQFQDSAGNERVLLGMLAHGITTIRNMDFLDRHGKWNFDLYGGRLLRLRARVASGALLGPRIYTSGPWGPPQYGGNDYSHQPRLDSIANYVAAYKAAGYDFIKIHDEERVIFDSVLTAARRVGIPVVGHLPSSVTIEEAFTAGYRSVEHLDGYHQAVIRSLTQQQIDTVTLADTFPPIPGLRELAAATQRAGVWNCPTQIIAELFSTPREVLLNRRIIKALQDAGALLLAGTDKMAGNPMMPMPDSLLWVQKELEALVRAGLTPYQALVTGTRNVAVYFGTLGEGGTVTVGKRADLVLLNGNPLVDIQYTRQIAGVMLGGRWFSHQELDQRIATTAIHETVPLNSRH